MKSPDGAYEAESGAGDKKNPDPGGVELQIRESRMEEKLSFKYDRDADILHIDKCPPYAEQESEELPDEIIARLNPKTGEVENPEVLFFSSRLLRSDLFELPISAALRLTGAAG